ncbi:MAG: hypothetical protein E6Q51_04125 [Methylophilus methylotrophus]|uniref:Uncharacterized protein n=1 Tax=Methylophilus methylotrophus TaxID=17 RepID=A0A5C7WK99_METME|nr:MAG: hypothetical protein E6Q51_04125 [Methylophilus methylotrophus]
MRIPETAGELKAQISDTMLRAPEREFEDYEDFDGVFYSMFQSVENLRKRFGDEKANQVLEMLAQAKAHYEAGDNKLAGALMEDTKMVIMKRQPWAYPKERYRWGVDPSLPEVSEADYLNKDEI